MAEPKPAPNLNIPYSDNTVNVSIIDTTSLIIAPTAAFMQPDHLIKNLVAPCYSFLIKHDNPRAKSKYDTVLFDLGLDKNWRTNLPQHAVDRLAGFTCTVEKNVDEILTENGLPLEKIGGVIWSHHHFDHTGDITAFPPSTDLIVGPGFKSALLPGFPEDPTSALPSSAWTSPPRSLIEISFADANTSADLKIGQFRAHDFYGDGSLYLLDTPGHAVGHMCALARVKGGDKPEFILMGGDIAHHAAEFRPTEYLPLPAEVSVPESVNDLARARNMVVCPGEYFEHLHPEKSSTKPFCGVSGPAHKDLGVAQESVRGWEEFDAQENVLAVVAHDQSLKGVLGYWPEVESAEGWREKGWKEEGRWRFLGDLREHAEGAGKAKA